MRVRRRLLRFECPGDGKAKVRSAGTAAGAAAASPWVDAAQRMDIVMTRAAGSLSSVEVSTVAENCT
jgi:hypothetical protein